jgi:hypothetical protein
VQSGDDARGSRLLDVIEGNAVLRSKPTPGLLHWCMLLPAADRASALPSIGLFMPGVQKMDASISSEDLCAKR